MGTQSGVQTGMASAAENWLQETQGQMARAQKENTRFTAPKYVVVIPDTLKQTDQHWSKSRDRTELGTADYNW